MDNQCNNIGQNKCILWQYDKRYNYSLMEIAQMSNYKVHNVHVKHAQSRCNFSLYQSLSGIK